MDSHQHEFAEAEWPFAEPSNTAVFTTAPVFRNELPVLLVTHDDDAWQFLCGTTTAKEDCRLVCFGCAYQMDKSIGELADLPVGWCAWRDTINDPWQRDVKAPRDDEA